MIIIIFVRRFSMEKQVKKTKTVKKEVVKERRKNSEVEHIFNQLYIIMKNHLKKKNFYILFSTKSGLIKGKWYPFTSIVDPELEIVPDTFLENQELIIDSCLHEYISEDFHIQKHPEYGEATIPFISYKDVLCLKDVTLYVQDKEIHLPSYILFTNTIMGFSLVKKNFKPF